MIIAVDHGNKQMKTINKTFTSGIVESKVKPPFGEDVLEYNGIFYSLSKERIPYMRDKTAEVDEQDQFFILTLFAIAYEIEAAGAYSHGEIINVQLAIGLPPAHFGGQYKKWEKNFTRSFDILKFTFRGKPYSVYISEAACFPQAYAAAMTMFARLKDLPKATVVDIGGYTVDYLLVKSGEPILEVCDSLEYGTIRLYTQIQSKIAGELDILVDEAEIDAVLLENPIEIDDEIRLHIQSTAQAYVNRLLNMMRERQVELKSGKTIFVGGGSILFRKQIEASGRVGSSIFVEDIAANVKGYDLLYKLSKARR